MKKNKFVIFCFVMTLSLAATAVRSEGVYSIDMSSFNMLPPHCQAYWAALYQGGKSEGIVINPEKYNIELWHERVGRSWVRFNHYCPALVDLNKLKFGRYKSSLEKDKLMKGASGNIEYLIAGGLDPQHAWISAEAHLKLAEFNELVNKDNDAVNLYQKAIEIHPSYIQAYAGLSDLYKKMGMKSEAKEILEKAIKIKPNSKALIRRLAKLEK